MEDATSFGARVNARRTRPPRQSAQSARPPVLHRGARAATHGERGVASYRPDRTCTTAGTNTPAAAAGVLTKGAVAEEVPVEAHGVAVDAVQ